MRVSHIDHVNIWIPEDGVEEALRFYQDVFGFEPEKLDAYQDGERTSFAFRLGETSLLHVRPKDDFERPSGRNYDHFCVVLEASIEEIRALMEEHDIEVRRESTPFGATGRAPAVYIEDPFGYVIEVKAQAR